MNCQNLIWRNRRIALASVAALSCAPAFAQSSLPSRLVAPSYEPGRITISKPLDVGQFAGAAVPPGAEKLRVKAGEIVIEDDPALLPGASEALAAALARKSITVADIFAAARAYERAYADAGYVLTRVVIPPQKLVNGGRVRLKIVNGFLESVSVVALPERIRDAVKDRLLPLTGRPNVTRAEIERAVLLAGDLAGVSLRSTLAPGSTPGGTQIVLDGAHEFMSGGFSIDNRADKSLGPWLFNANAAINSAFGQGEQIYVAWAGSPKDPLTAQARVRTFALGASVPIGVNGLSVSPEVTWSESIPKVTTVGVPSSKNDFLRLALRGNYALIRGVDGNLALRGGVERVEQKVRYPTSPGGDKLDRYTVARASLEGQELFAFGSLTQAVSISQGLGGRDQADADASGVDLSRSFTKPTFTKLGFATQGRYATEDVAIALTFRSQYSFNQALFASEQLGLDGSDALSGFTNGAIAVDQGAVVRGEVSPAQPVMIAQSLGVSPYLFSAFGVGVLRHATAVETPLQRVTSYGVGLRSSLNDIVPGVPGVLWQAEFAHNIPSPSIRQPSNRFSTSLSLRF